MPLAILAADHHDVALPDLTRLSAGAEAAGSRLSAHPAVEGVVVLSTCNRVEIYLDAHSVEPAIAAARDTLAEMSGTSREHVASLTSHAVGQDVVQHVFEVAAGLDSMVVGEREVAGQLRRALQAARRAGTTSPLLEDVFQRASRASRRIAVSTDLAAAGRSIVSVALDLASARSSRPGCPREVPAWADTDDGPHLPTGSWAGARAVVLGTGAYAGATIAALRRRACGDIAVWSSSGRAEEFAARHDVAALPVDGLVPGLAGADLVVSCRGTGAPVVDVATTSAALAQRPADAAPLVIADLALRRDVSPDVADLPGVVVLDLETVRSHAPAATDGQVHHAQEIVGEELDEFLGRRAERAMDDVVVGMRDHVGTALEAELARLPMSGVVDAAHAAQALRRLAAKLLHEPTVAARTAGREGRGQEFVEALALVSGATARQAGPGGRGDALPRHDTSSARTATRSAATG